MTLDNQAPKQLFHKEHHALLYGRSECNQNQFAPSGPLAQLSSQPFEQTAPLLPHLGKSPLLTLLSPKFFQEEFFLLKLPRGSCHQVTSLLRLGLILSFPQLQNLSSFLKKR